METYYGFVRTPQDAIKLFEACRLGQLPRVQRRLSEKERQSIRSGSVFVWDEREAGMRRWTDGKSWSASRVSGSFLTYREMEGKRGTTFGASRRSNGRTPDSNRFSDEDPDGEPEGYRYKADGLMKQSFSITTSTGQHLHLISYYSRPHGGGPDMLQPSTDPQLRHIVPMKGMYPESSLHDSNPPALTRTPMQPYHNRNGAMEQASYNYGNQWGSPAPAWQGPWPPSPNTPPWRPGRHTPEAQLQARAPPQQQPAQRPPQPLVLPPTSTPSAQGPMYHTSLGGYENDRLPPPAMARAYPVANTAGGRASSLSPQSQPVHIPVAQAAQVAQVAQAVQTVIDPRLAATSARNPQGPLPALSSASRGLTPPRTHSVSPPRTASYPAQPAGTHTTNDNTNKASLSALLNRTPANSEPNSANPGSNNSASSSPRAVPSGASGVPATTDMFRGEDTRAIRSLDRKFCI